VPKRNAKMKSRESTSVIKPEYKRTHVPDGLATALRAAVQGAGRKIDLSKLASVAAENGLSLEAWSRLNAGLQRMGLGNVLRARVRRGETVTIGGRPFKKLSETATATQEGAEHGDA
jgi:hypothetical protein